ncbi:MAG: GNAT family N-acetyltransferase [Gemmatimonadales bacterium]
MEARRASEKDISELVRVINAAFRVEDFFISGDRTNPAEIAVRMADPEACILVVDRDDSAALAAAVIVEVHGRRGHFAMLSVDPPSQGRGLARFLMTAVEDHCLAAGCESLDLAVVNLREELPAFYTAMGFVPVDTAPFPDKEKLRRDAHMVLMTKRLAG